jgi:hypothetical protein
VRLHTTPAPYAGCEVRIMVKPVVRPESWGNDDDDPAGGGGATLVLVVVPNG